MAQHGPGCDVPAVDRWGHEHVSDEELRRAIDIQAADAQATIQAPPMMPGAYAQEEYPFLPHWKRDEARRVQAFPKQRTKPPGSAEFPREAAARTPQQRQDARAPSRAPARAHRR